MQETVTTEGLNKEQLELLKTLGLLDKPEKKKADKKLSLGAREKLARTHTCPDEEYWLKLTKVCDCCGTVEVLEGKMRQIKDFHSYLSFDTELEIPEDEIYRVRRITSLTCKSCEIVLEGKSKEELIRMIKSLHEGVRNA